LFNRAFWWLTLRKRNAKNAILIRCSYIINVYRIVYHKIFTERTLNKFIMRPRHLSALVLGLFGREVNRQQFFTDIDTKIFFFDSQEEQGQFDIPCPSPLHLPEHFRLNEACRTKNYH